MKRDILIGKFVPIKLFSRTHQIACFRVFLALTIPLPLGRIGNLTRLPIVDLKEKKNLNGKLAFNCSNNFTNFGITVSHLMWHNTWEELILYIQISKPFCNLRKKNCH